MLARVSHCTIVTPPKPKVTKVTVFKAGQDGYHTYRIPVIVRAKNGDLLAFAEGRKNGRDDHGDIDIVLKRSSDSGQTWGPLQLVQDECGRSDGESLDRQSDAGGRFAGPEASGPNLAGVHAQQRARCS